MTNKIVRPDISQADIDARKIIQDEARKEITKTVKRNKTKRQYQTTVAEMIGGKNIGTLGGEDVEHPEYTVECKSLKRFAGEKVLLQAEGNNPGNRVSIGFVHILGQRHHNDVVLMRYRDWIKISKAIKKGFDNA